MVWRIGFICDARTNVWGNPSSPKHRKLRHRRATPLRIGALLIATLSLGGTTADAQVVEYPPAIPESLPQSSNAIPSRIESNNEVPIERFRRSFFQGAHWRSGYWLGLGDRLGGLDITLSEVGLSFGVPLGSMDHVLAMQPYFQASHFNGPSALDVPGTLYDTGVRFLVRSKWTPLVSTTVLVSPSVRSDFHTSTDATRVFGLGLVNWQANPAWRYSVGAVYLDREDVRILPAVGFVWTPTPQWKVDGMFPRPRIAKRLCKNGPLEERWAYLGGTFGGNSWSVQRAAGGDDQLTLQEFGLLAGYEVIRAGNRGLVLELGYGFARSLEYASDQIERDLDDALFASLVWKF